MSVPQISSTSPKWTSITKLVIGLTIIALIASVVIYFRVAIGPLLLAFIMAYLLHPVVNLLSSTTRLNWRMSVNLVYLVVLILLAGLFTWSGLAIIQQFQSLIRVVQNFIDFVLPTLVADLSTNVYMIGPFVIDLNQYDLNSLIDQVLGIVQPVLGQTANIASTLATSAAGAFGWLLFILVVSYFTLAGAGRFPSKFFQPAVPGYEYDIRRLTFELQKIWHAFLRGQLIIFGFAVILNLILLSALGLRIALGIAIIAGLAKFVPYLGPLAVLVVAGVVAFLQPSNIFGLLSWQYMVLVLILIMILDQSFDNIVTPRLLGRTLNLHPAAILVAALIAFDFIGMVGLMVAAPVLATIKLIMRYTTRKMFDLDPWKETIEQQPMELPWIWAWRVSQELWRYLRTRISGPKNSAE